MPHFLRRCIALGLALAACSAYATVSLTTGPDYAPFTDHNVADGGIAVRLVRATFARINESVALDWLPWKRGYSLTLAGHYQATFPYAKSAERERDFIFSDPLMTMQTYLYMRHGDHLDYDTPSSFSGRVICVPQGFYSQLQTNLRDLTARGEVRVEQAPDMPSCVRMLLAGRVDAFTAFDKLIQHVLLQTGGAERVEHSVKAVSATDLMLIAPRNNPDSIILIQRFNAALQALKADGSYKRLFPD